MTPGAQLRAWRLEQGWSVARLACELGCSETTVYAWQAGRSRPCEWRRERIERMTGIAADSWPLERHAPRNRARKREAYHERKAAGRCVECEDPMDREGACCEACLWARRGCRPRVTEVRGERRRRARKRRPPIRRAPSWIETWREMRRAS